MSRTDTKRNMVIIVLLIVTIEFVGPPRVITVNVTVKNCLRSSPHRLSRKDSGVANRDGTTYQHENNCVSKK